VSLILTLHNCRLSQWRLRRDVDKGSWKAMRRAAIPGSNQGTAERPGVDEGRLQTGWGEAAFV